MARLRWWIRCSNSPASSARTRQVAERVMDSNDLERERGITILSKNTAVHYDGVPHQHRRHPRPRGLLRRGGARAENGQRRASAGGFLRRAHAPDPFRAEKGAGTEPEGHHRHQQDGSPRRRAAPRWWTKPWSCCWSWTPPTNSWTAPSCSPPAAPAPPPLDWQKPGTDLKPLFDVILSHIPAPEGDPEGRLQLLISTIDYNDYVGRIGVGRIERGTISRRPDGHSLRATAESFVSAPARLGGLYEFDGLKRVNCESAKVGDIVAVSGFEDLLIGDTICQPGHGGAPALCEDRRADRFHDLRGQRQPLRRHRGHSTSPPAICGPG